MGGKKSVVGLMFAECNSSCHDYKNVMESYYHYNVQKGTKALCESNGAERTQ